MASGGFKRQYVAAPKTHNVKKGDDKTTLEITNPTTGEITEWDISTAEGLARAYEAATKLETALKKAKDTMKNRIRDVMGDDEEKEAGKNFRFVRTQRQSYGYERAMLADIIDDDTLATVSKIDTKMLETLVAEWKEGGILNEDELARIKEAKVPVSVSKVLKVERLLSDE